MKTRDREKESRESIVLMLLILLLGFICIILTSGWALRFAPSWRLPADMGSNLNPDSEFRTGVPDSFFEPLDPSILTNPAWFDVFLTPDAPFATHPPLPTLTNTPAPTNTNTSIPVITNSPTSTPLPTNTVIFFPPFTATPRPPRPPRDTPTASPVPALSADLQITKTDNVGAYVSGGTLTYTIVVSNNGPDNVNSAAVTDNFPAQIASATWTCTGASGATCTASGLGNISDSVNLPASSSVTYTVSVTISTGAMGDLTNTALADVPSGYVDPAPGNNSATDMDTQFILADLAITKDDGVGVTTYVPGGTLTYIITVTNNGPDNISNATVTDNFPAQVASANWTCVVVTGSATCTASGTGNISDSVDLPAGSLIRYTVDVTIAPGATGDLTNEAIVGFSADDPVPGNNRATDTDTQAP